MISLPPIYSEVYHLTREILLYSRKFPKHYRPTLGRMMEEASLDLTILLRQELLKKAEGSMTLSVRGWTSSKSWCSSAMISK